MLRTKRLIWVAAAICPVMTLAVARELPTSISPVTSTRADVRDTIRNPRPSIEERLTRIEQLGAQLQQEAKELRQDLHLAPPQTQPVVPLEGEHVPSVHFR